MDMMNHQQTIEDTSLVAVTIVVPSYLVAATTKNITFNQHTSWWLNHPFEKMFVKIIASFP